MKALELTEENYSFSNDLRLRVGGQPLLILPASEGELMQIVMARINGILGRALTDPFIFDVQVGVLLFNILHYKELRKGRTHLVQT